MVKKVDKDVIDNNERGDVADMEDDQALDDEDVQLRGELEEHLKNKFSTFNAEVDMNNPEFKVGMLFSGVKEFRKALQKYNINNRVKVKKN
jgi:hypothetical protein